jgi:TonB family protein
MKTKLITCLLVIVSINTFGQTLNSSIKSKFKEAILYVRENSVDNTGKVLFNSAYSVIIHTLSKVSDNYYPEFKNLTYGEADKELQNIDKNPKLLKAYILTSFDLRDFKESALKNIFGLTDEEIQIVYKYIKSNKIEDKVAKTDTIVPKEAPKEVEIFDRVEVMPSFPGGSSELTKFLDSNVKYPIIAKENYIEGKVMVKLLINSDGSISDITILKGLGAGCDEEAIRVIKLMPKWNPGLERGKPVKTSIVFSVKFTPF